MMSKPILKIDPIDAGLTANKPDLVAAVDRYLASEFPKGLSKMDRIWVCYVQEDESFRIIGVMGCVMRPDVPLYHIQPSSNREEQWEAAQANELMFNRLSGYMADHLGSGTEVSFFVPADTHDKWKEFVSGLVSRKLERYIIEV